MEGELLLETRKGRRGTASDAGRGTLTMLKFEGKAGAKDWTERRGMSLIFWGALEQRRIEAKGKSGIHSLQSLEVKELPSQD